MDNKENLQYGVVRRVDDLGRIVIPKELRQQMGIDVDSPLSITYDGTSIRLTPYDLQNPLTTRVDSLRTTLDAFADCIDKTTYNQLNEQLKSISKTLQNFRTKNPDQDI